MKQAEVFGNALWVGAENADPKQYLFLRGSFSTGKVQNARLRVLGLGYFHCYINGVRVGDDLFLPLNTDYEARRDYPIGEVLSGHRIYVPEYDITSMLKEGENSIVIHFGGGWYANTNDKKAFGTPKAIWRVWGEDEKGTFDFVSSRADRLLPSFASHGEFTRDECHDYRLGNLEDAIATEAENAAWTQADAVAPLDTEYLFTDCPADGVCEELTLSKLWEADGITLYDCGKNISGYPVLKLLGRAGDVVTVTLSEQLEEDGKAPSARFGHKQTFTLVCDGTERVAHPEFIWFGFRYFSVQGPAEAVCAHLVHTKAAVTSAFASDNDLLNWIHDTFIHTQLTNMHGGIPSDCPHIERRGYTGDGQLVCHAAMSVLDGEAFYRKWIGDIADCQDVLSGHIQYTAPYIHSGGGPGGWGCAIVEVPYQFYKHYGDASVLRDCYPNMMRYFDYLEAHSENDLILSDKEGEWCLGDWCPPISVVLPAPFVNNYFYVKSLLRCIEIAKLIGKEEDIPLFEARIAARKRAIMNAYYNKWDGNFLGCQQGANAFAVDIGLGDERTYPNMVAYYDKLGRYDTGIFGTDLVTRILFERGDGEVAVKILTSTHTHSYAEMRRRGATTIWEYWPESLRDRSRNHPMFGAVVAAFYEYLLGIRQTEDSAGYEQLEIAPVLVKAVDRLTGYRMLPQGRISVSYERHSEDRVDFAVEIPEGQMATFVYGGERYPLTSGMNRFSL